MMTAEQIVEVVRDAAGELADRFHLLRLAQLRLDPLFVGDVSDEQQQRGSRPSHPLSWLSRIRAQAMAPERLT